MIFITGTQSFPLLMPESGFLEKVLIINADNNEEFKLNIAKKFNVRFVEGFSGLLCINIAWHYGNRNVKCFFR